MQEQSKGVSNLRCGLWLLCLVALLSISSTTAAQQVERSGITTSTPIMLPEQWPQDWAQLLEEIEQRATRLGIGYAELVVFNGQGVIRRARFGEHKFTTPPQVLAGQLTEVYTALAVMQLIERGEWSLYDRVSDRLPDVDIAQRDEAQQPLLLLHLLEHSSGLDQRRFKSHFLSQRHAGAALLERLAQEQDPMELKWSPGEAARHSALNYVLLAAMLEQYHQKPWATVIEESVLLPLSLNYTKLHGVQAEEVQLAGHSGLPQQALPLRNRAFVEAEGIWTNIDDLVRLGQLLLSRGASSSPALLRADTIATMETPRSTLAADAGLDYGMGVALDTRARYGFWHGRQSSLDGFSANIRYRAEHDVGYALVVNHETLLPALDELVWQYMATQLPLPNPRAGGVSVEQRWSGWYRLHNPEHALLAPIQQLFDIAYMQIEGADLTLQPLFAAKVPLRSIDGSRLAHRQDGSVVGVLFSDELGQQRIQVHQDVRYRTSAFKALAPLVFLLVASLVLLTHPFGRFESLRHPWMRRFTTLAMLCFVLAAFVAGSLTLEQASHDNWRSVLLFIFTALAPLFAFTGLITTLRYWREETNAIARWRALVGALLASALAAWLIHAGWFALRIWAW